MRFTTYIDLPFLERHHLAKPIKDPSEYDATDDYWLNLQRFLRQTRLIVKADIEDLPHNPILFALLSSGRYDVQFNTNAFREIEQVGVEDIMPCSLFLMESPPASHYLLCRRWGFAVSTYDQLSTIWPTIGVPSTWNISKDPFRADLRSWRDLQNCIVPINALIVCDRYLLKNDRREKDRGLRNLLDIFDSLLPHVVSDLKVDIMVITDLDEMDSLPERIYDLIKDELQALRPKLCINLAIVHPNSKGHQDRYIFTNYALLVSGDSFTYFDGNGRITKETTLDWKPLLFLENFRLAQQKLQELKKWVDNPQKKVSTNNHGEIHTTSLAAGTLENRLFRIIPSIKSKEE